jgi:hypothetical protein
MLPLGGINASIGDTNAGIGLYVNGDQSIIERIVSSSDNYPSLSALK